MRKYFRSRFICGAMLSFFILVVIAVSGIFFFSYHQMEKESDDFLTAMLSVSDDQRGYSQAAPPPMFGYTPNDRSILSGFYDILMDQDGNVLSIEQHGIAEDAVVSVQQYVQQAAKSDQDSGKIGSYKFSMVRNEDGTVRMILLDISIQLQGLFNIMRSAAVVVIALMILLFIILLPVSSKVANAFVRNAETQKRFITDASHELKTPVAIIRANLDTMELLQGKNNWSGNIRCQVGRLEKLISQLLMMARLEEFESAGKKTPVNMSSMIKDEWENYRPSVEKKNLQSQLNVPEGLKVRGWEKTLRQMLSLLLDNAVQYTNDGGTITLKAETSGKRFHMVMANTVSALPAQAPEELTERFTRGTTARTQSGSGAGVGLSAVKRIVQMHGGQLNISYENENIFQVTIDLPQ